jgi:hypothetical protein
LSNKSNARVITILDFKLYCSKEQLNILSPKGNENQSELIFYLTPVRMAVINKKKTTSNADEDTGGKELSYTVGGNVN